MTDPRATTDHPTPSGLAAEHDEITSLREEATRLRDLAAAYERDGRLTDAEWGARARVHEDHIRQVRTAAGEW